MLSKVTMGVLPLNPKARFCVKCKDYFPVSCFVSDDGKDDPLLCNRHEHAKKRLRYCRGCDDFIALDLFTPGKTYSFACRKHLTEYGGAREAQQKKLQNVGQKRRINAWKQCHNDRKRFRQEKIQINQSEIEAAVLKVDPAPLPGVYAAVPVDCTCVLSAKNIAVVSMSQRKELIRIFRTNDTAKYSETLACFVSLQPQ